LGRSGDHFALVVDLGDLVHINDVGPAFARFLLDLDIRGPRDLHGIGPVAALDRNRDSIAGEPNPGPDLWIEDLDYCRRLSGNPGDDIVPWRTGLRTIKGA
jgi:hypothetical protein